MTFRLFVYYCSLCGAWAALFGWAFGRAAAVADPIPAAGLKGLCLGLFVSLALGSVDAIWNLPPRRFIQIGLRVAAAVLVGSIGGMFGGIIGQVFFGWKPWSAFLIFGWTLTGLLIGASVGIFELLVRFVRQENLASAVRKVVHGALGGTGGGFLGGLLSVFLKGSWDTVFRNKPVDELWSPSATGFVALGMCIGLLIGVAQVVLKEAWIKVETGRRAGKEMILGKPEFVIGRAEACDLGLFGDPTIEKQHARILLQAGRYLLADLDTPGGTYLNDRRVHGPTPLNSGDAIRVGTCVLRFGERRKHG